MDSVVQSSADTFVNHLGIPRGKGLLAEEQDYGMRLVVDQKMTVTRMRVWTRMIMKVMLQIWEPKMVRSHGMRMICMRRVMMSFNCSKLGILVVVL